MRRGRRMRRAKAPRHKKKINTWTIPTLLGLALGLVGALGVIELRPQLNVSPGEPLAHNQPFSAPFDVTNTGYVSVHIRNITVIEHRIEQRGLTVTDGSMNNKTWDNFDLERGGS